ncbi:DUF6272 family protein [Paracrocinitomix mangrovi]|uniref:DUF6272 family protein n=1 Tax=Paracrocinitomix mangrovi TaxID=2862509 RepID=UPI001C8EE549|nr:DUF6272 family protein [Paracrocinitomix mangrovi]UKN01608.1 DUF6272 family protein [Paracrocinitomix mangrovi]
MQFVLELQKLMVKNNYLIAIRDNFENLLAKSVLKITDTKISEDEVEIQVKNRVFSVIVECVQNVCSSETNNYEDRDSVLLMNRIENGFQIAAGTKVNEQRKERLKNLLDQLQSKELNEIKKDKLSIMGNREVLTSEMQDELTFMEIYIRSNRNVNFYFEDGEDGTFLMLKIDITN